MLRSGRCVPILVLLCGLGLCACGQQSGNGTARSGAPSEVGVITVEPRRTELKVQLPGRTHAFAVSEVRPQVGGILQARLFAEGSHVEAGQPLYQIDDTLYRATLERATAQLASARAALTTAQLRATRFESLRNRQSISQQDNDDARAALQQARANVAEQEASVAIARINLGYTHITAPIAGRISRSYLTRGALVTAGQAQALAMIQTLDPIYVDINQSSTGLLNLTAAAGALKTAAGAGRPATAEADAAGVTLMLDDGSSYPLRGTLQFSEVVVDPTTGTVTLRAEFPNPDGVLLPGMFVRATVVIGVQENALLVPQRGVSRDNKGRATALIVDPEGIVRQRTLTVAQTVGSDWLVTGGIDAGDRVIVEGLQFVRAGQPVVALPFVGSEPVSGLPGQAAN